MTILGNIFLGLAALISFIFASSLMGKEVPRGGDAAVGYVWGVVIFYLLFFVCMTVVAIAIGWKGGFDWISPSKGVRFLLVAFGLLGAMITAALSLLFKGNEPGSTAAVFSMFSGYAPVLVPLLMIFSGAILLNDGLLGTLPKAVYKIPLMVIFGIGFLSMVGGIVAWMRDSNQHAMERLKGVQADQDRYHQDHLNSIDACDVTKNISNILVYTDSNHDADVRERALAKIKTRSDWQQELVRLLENKGAVEAFVFLASNEVDDKALFVGPVNTGVLSIADWMQRQISEATQAHYFYAEQFSWEVERVLRTVDKFEGMGTDYRPAVRAMRAALDLPSEIEKPKFKCIATLDYWIKKHQ